MTLPNGYDEVLVEGARAFVWRQAGPWARSTLSEHGTLDAWAASVPEARKLSGRGTVRVVPAAETGPDGRSHWVVRRYLRGGAVARILHDTYFRAGPTRPLRELTASVAARARGVSVPAVVAGAVYPAGPLHYRADLVTELVPDARDLAEVLFGHPEQERRAEAGGDRAAALRATGQLVAQAGAAGVHHPDLNAKNVVLRLTAPNALDVDAWIVDLDRCRVRAAPRPEADTGAMLGRLERSLRKFERAGGRRLADDDWIALRQGAGDWRSVHRRGSDPGASGGAG